MHTHRADSRSSLAERNTNITFNDALINLLKSEFFSESFSFIEKNKIVFVANLDRIGKSLMATQKMH